VLNEESDASVTSYVFTNANFGVANAWAWPRRLYLGVRYYCR